MFRIFKLAYRLEHDHLAQSLFYNKMLTILCSFLNDALKVKTKMVAWVQNDYKCFGYLSSWSCGWPGAACCCPELGWNIVLHITISGKDQNSKFLVWFLLSAFSPSLNGKILSKWKNVSQRPSVLYTGLLLVLNEKNTCKGTCCLAFKRPQTMLAMIIIDHYLNVIMLFTLTHRA